MFVVILVAVVWQGIVLLSHTESYSQKDMREVTSIVLNFVLALGTGIVLWITQIVNTKSQNSDFNKEPGL